MNLPSVYINLEDDVSKVAARLKKEKAREVILVCPKRCFLFHDSVNLLLLKKQVEILDKKVFVFTMDEKGQQYALAAGFELRDVFAKKTQTGISDIKQQTQKIIEQPVVASVKPENKTEELPKPAQVKPAFSTFIAKTPPPAELEKPVFITKPAVEKKSIFTPTKLTAVFLIVSLFCASWLVLFALPKGEVVIFPKSEQIIRDMEVVLDPQNSGIDPNKLAIKSDALFEEKFESGKFESQGKKSVGNKASGTVKIYNFTALPLNLKAATTIISIGEKNFRLTSDVLSLKPTKYSNAKTKEIDEASLGDSYEVVAEQGGENYNLPAGTRLEITNQVLGSKPQVIYARIDSAIVGGTTRYLSVVTDQDIANAQKSLADKILNSLRNNLSSQGKVLLDKSFQIEVQEFSADKPSGTESPSFNAQLKIKISGFVFFKKDLEDLVYARVVNTVSKNKILKKPESSSISYAVKDSDIASLKGSLSVHFEGKAFFSVNMQNLAGRLKNKTADQADELIRRESEVERVDVVIAPSWRKNLPLISNKIKVTVQEK